MGQGRDSTADAPLVDVLVAGAGISGLSCALALKRSGLRVQVLEAADRAGGVIGSVARDGFLFERGPNSTLDTSPVIGELIGSLGLAPRQRWASAAAERRYVVRGGQLTALPGSPGAFLATRLFSWRAKLALLREPFVGRSPATAEESIAQFVRRRLGPEFLDYAIDPFVAGIYAGDPEHVSVRAAFPKLHALEQRWGSLLRGQVLGARQRRREGGVAKNVARSFSFDGGMQTLTDALAAAVGPLSLQTRVTGLVPGPQGWQVQADQQGQLLHWRAHAVVLATPAPVAAQLLSGLAPAAASALANIRYAALASVASAYAAEQVQHALDGFGCLVPRCEQRRLLGTLFSSSMFKGRAPKGSVLLTSFVGGQRQPVLAALPDEDIGQLVHEEQAALLGVQGPPRWQVVTRWPQAIPQYNLGHLDRLASIEAAMQQHPGLVLLSNWKGGVAVGDCIREGLQCGQRLGAEWAARR